MRRSGRAISSEEESRKEGTSRGEVRRVTLARSQLGV